MIKIKLLAFLLLPISLISNNGETLNKKSKIDEAIGYLGKSKAVQIFDKFINTKIRTHFQQLMKIGNTDASSEFQSFGKEAQAALGIPENCQLPIKKIDPASPLVKIVGAVAEPNAIYVSDRLNDRTYGAKRCALFHEAVHVKYNDSSMDQLLEILVLPITFYLTYKGLIHIKSLENRKTLKLVASSISAIGVSGLLGIYYKYYFERRADIEGHYATHCYMCVNEHSERRKISFEVEKNPLRDTGYLWAKDLKQISEDLKMKNEICDFHKSNPYKEEIKS